MGRLSVNRYVRTRVSLLALVVCGAALAQSQEPAAWDLYQLGLEAEKAGHIAQAYLYYSEAAAQDPKNQKYWQKSKAIATRAALEAKVMPYLPPKSGDSGQADDDAPEPEAASYEDLQASRELRPPAALEVAVPLRDYDFQGDSRALFTSLAKDLGLDCVFDDDYTPTKSIHFALQQVDYKTAIHGLEAATGSFIVPVTPKIFMVVKDTPLKRVELAPRVAVSIPLAETVTQQDFNGVVTAVQQVLAIEKISFDTATRTVIIRDILPKAIAARALFNDLMKPRPQVMLDVKFIEVTRNDVLTYGINFPNYFSLTPLTTWLNNPVSVANTISGLLSFGGGKTLIGLGVMMPSMVAELTKAKGSNLLDSSAQAADGQPVSMHFGEHYPVMSAGYFGPSSFYTGGTVYSPTPSFTFEDLGLTIKITPSLRNTDSVSLDLDAEFKSLTGQSVNGIPIISNESVKSAVAMKAGQWAVMGGMMTVSQAKTVAGLAGLSRIPIVGPLTSTHNDTTSTDQVLILIRPRVLSLPASATGPTLTLSVGSATRPVTLL